MRPKRERATCPDCGKPTTIRRDGEPMAHRRPDGSQCKRPAWKDRAAAAR